MMNKHIILDLDGTLLFAEERPDALMVPGRRRNAYMARETIDLLKRIQDQRQIILATGRSRSSVLGIIRDLKAEGLRIEGTAAENGGIWIERNGDSTVFVEQDWIALAKRLEACMPEMIQAEFESCVALLNPDASALQMLDDLTREWGLNHRRLRDGNKLFVLAPEIDKKHALEYKLGRASLQSAWGIGNDLNDLDWMQEVAISAAPACSKEELLKTVREQQGLISIARGHDGIAEILILLESMRNEELQALPRLFPAAATTA